MTRKNAEKTTATVARDAKSGQKTVILTLENSLEDRLKTLNQMMRVRRALSEGALGQRI
jgi:hypothetical protein